MKKIMSILLGVWFLIIPQIVSLASASNPTLTVTTMGGDSANIVAYCSEVNAYTEKKGFTFIDVRVSNKTVTMVFDFTKYKRLKQSEKSEIMEVALSKVSNSNISTSSKNKIYNFISNQDESTASLVRQLKSDIKVDFARAYSYFRPFNSVVGVILGGIALLLMLTLTSTILLDISYISIPIIQNWLGSNGKPKLVSYEAVESVKESESTGRDASVIYLGKKSKQLIVVSVSILYLASGKIFEMIGGLIDLFQGFF